jgi:methionyl-tRNA formyltransferase
MAKLAFLGTPSVAADTLAAICEAGHEVGLVVTGEDKRRGRRGPAVPSPVKEVATDAGLPVTADPNDLLQQTFDLGVVVAYGRIIRPTILAHLDLVNIHFSILPRWRGAAPVERAILAGDAESGVSIMKLEEGLDTGPVYGEARTPILDSDTAETLRSRLSELGIGLLLRLLKDGFPEPRPQIGEPTYAAKILPADRCIDWAEPAEKVLARVRIGRAWTTWMGQRLIVESARLADQPADLAPGQVMFLPPRGVLVGTGGGLVSLEGVAPAGRSSQNAVSWANGQRLPAGVPSAMSMGQEAAGG